MTYDEVKDQLKVGDYWLISWDNNYIVGYIGHTNIKDDEIKSLGIYFPGSNTCYYSDLFTNYIRKIDIFDKLNEL